MVKGFRSKKLNPDTVVLLKQIFYGFLSIGSVAIILTGIWHGTRINSLTIDTILVSGGETIRHSLVEELAFNELEGEYINFIPRKFSWFYPKKSIEEKLSQIDRIHSINIQKTNSKSLKINFDEYVPHALWCNAKESRDCIFLDEKGFAFAKAPDLTGGAFIRFSKINESYELKSNIIETDKYRLINELSDLLAQNNWYTARVEIDNENDAYFHIVGGGELKITLRQTPLKTADNLFVVISSEEFKHIAPGNFKYIDLRYGEKVYVNEELEPKFPEMVEETSTSTEVAEE